MGKFFGNNQEATQLSPREILQNKYNAARANLIWMLAFTVINIVLLLINSSSYFLFSLYIPYMFMLVGLVITGKLPELYTEMEYAQTEFLPEAALIIPAVVVIVILVLFLLCWIFSKKNRVGWLIAALVMFCIDTLFLLLGGIDGDSIIDILFHAWVIISLAGGISAHYKLKKLPPEEEIIETTAEVVETAEIEKTPVFENSPILRCGELDDKCRILLATEKGGLSITYRRVKKVNELVINGNVYDEYTALIEGIHTLSAVFANHKIEAGFDGFNSFIKIDGELVAKKLRLV